MPAVSSVGTQNDTATANRLPQGAALKTSAGDLLIGGIQGIIHIDPKSITDCGNNEHTYFQAIALAVKNSLILANRNQYQRVAIPFIGSGLVGGNCNREKLAKIVVNSAIQNAEGQTELTFIIRNTIAINIFKNSYSNKKDLVSKLLIVMTF